MTPSYICLVFIWSPVSWTPDQSESNIHSSLSPLSSAAKCYNVFTYLSFHLNLSLSGDEAERLWSWNKMVACEGTFSSPQWPDVSLFCQGINMDFKIKLSNKKQNKMVEMPVSWMMLKFFVQLCKTAESGCNSLWAHHSQWPLPHLIH